MKKLLIGAGLLLLTIGSGYVFTQTVIMQRPLSSLGLSSGVGYGTTEPTIANSGNPPTDGELFIVRAAGTADPDVKVYSAYTGSWLTALLTGGTDAVTLSPAFSASGNVTLGGDEDDDITMNGPVTFEVRREDFDFVPPLIVESDFTAAVVADTTANLIGPFPQIGWLYYRIELAFGGTYDATTVFNGGVFLLDDAALVDLADNDAVEFVIGGPPTTAVFFDEDSTESAYCETSITLTDISDLSANDLYFGAFLAAAIEDTFAYETADTWAGFSILDNAGDLVIAAELNAGTHGEDDTGETWADLETHVLRVTMSADSVAFSVDGTAVTQTNAVLNADAGDEFVCRIGFRSAGTASAGVQVNYFELGRAQ